MNTIENTAPHSAFVRLAPVVEALGKPGSEIADSMTPLTAVLMHAGWGMVGELLEMDQAATRGDLENWVEEAGDVMFYIVMSALAMGTNLSVMPLALEDEVGDADAMMREQIGALSGRLKKVVVYGAPIDATTHALPITAFWGLCLVIDRARLDVSEVVDAVIGKLAVRFPEGVYSNTAAVTRADKQ